MLFRTVSQGHTQREHISSISFLVLFAIEIISRRHDLYSCKVQGKSLCVWEEARGMWRHWRLCRGWAVRPLPALRLHQQLLRPALVSGRDRLLMNEYCPEDDDVLKSFVRIFWCYTLKKFTIFKSCLCFVDMRHILFYFMVCPFWDPSFHHKPVLMDKNIWDLKVPEYQVKALEQ